MRALLIVLLTLLASWPQAFHGQEVIIARRRVASGGGGGTPAIVQAAVNSSAMNFGSGSVTLGSAATAGNIILVEFIQANTSNTVTVSDNLGNSLTQSAAGNQVTNCCFTGSFLASFSYVVPSSGVTSFNFTFTSSFGEAIVMEVSGLSSATLQAYSADVGPSSNPSPTATPTASPSLALGIYFVGSGTPTAGTGWTAVNSGVSTNGELEWIEYKAVTGTSAVTPTVSGVASTDAWAHIW